MWCSAVGPGMVNTKPPSTEDAYTPSILSTQVDANLAPPEVNKTKIAKSRISRFGIERQYQESYRTGPAPHLCRATGDRYGDLVEVRAENHPKTDQSQKLKENGNSRVMFVPAHQLILESLRRRSLPTHRARSPKCKVDIAQPKATVARCAPLTESCTRHPTAVQMVAGGFVRKSSAS
ncbi:hypothetical protein B0H19DRAFT_1082748 [Mycena capillaripes]|nr:hypothetical protein B0H19DRAFT_1082748 [Mycena capillaripes]